MGRSTSRRGGGAPQAPAETERERVLHVSSHTGLMQVVPGHPPADPRVHTNKSCVAECILTTPPAAPGRVSPPARLPARPPPPPPPPSPGDLPPSLPPRSHRLPRRPPRGRARRRRRAAGRPWPGLRARPRESAAGRHEARGAGTSPARGGGRLRGAVGWCGGGCGRSRLVPARAARGWRGGPGGGGPRSHWCQCVEQ